MKERNVETVMEGLRHCARLANHDADECRTCPYAELDMADEQETQCFYLVVGDALRALEQLTEKKEDKND